MEESQCCVLVVCASEEEVESDDHRRFDNDDKKDEQKEDSGGSSVNNAQDNLHFLQITPTSIQVQFPGITGGNLMYVEDRLYFGTRGDIPWENAIILEGNKIFTLTGLTERTKYRLRWQAPDSQYPDVEVSTQPLSNKKAPKVIVTKKTFDSITLSFDHFAPEDYQHQYIALVSF